MKKLVYILMLIVVFIGIESLADENVTKQDIKDLNSSIIKKIDAMDKYSAIKSHLVPIKDIEFLYDVNIGKDYTFVDKDISIIYNIFQGDEVIDKRTHIALQNVNIGKYKLLAVEEVLELNATRSLSLKERLDKAYKAIGYDDWDEDRIKFIVTTNYVQGLDEVVTGVGAEVFPSYRKYISGNIDLLRRYAIYISVANSNKADDPIYSMGVNIELQNGFGINIGAAHYSIDEKEELKMAVGVVLSSDLWKKIFNLEE